MRFTPSIHFWPVVLLAVLLADLLMFWGGYQGRLGVLSLWLIKGPFIGIGFFLLMLVAHRYWRERHYATLTAGIFVCLALGCNLLVMNGYRAPFILGAKARLLNAVDPMQLQSWAKVIIQEHEGEKNVYIPPKDMPTFLKLPRWPLSGASIRSVRGERFVEVGWGSGMAGSYGFIVGSSNFVASYGVLWKPGIYFYNAK